MPNLPSRTASIVLIGLSLVAATVRAQPPGRMVGPWDLGELKQVPSSSWGEDKDRVREVYYEGAKLDGKPTRVFGYYARPETGDGPFPAMLLVHGGGGKAFSGWARLWADRGYVALAMDLAGHGPDGKRLPDGGPGQDDPTKFRDFDPARPESMWTYHAVAAIVRGHSLLAAREEVDAGRVGVTGISWGGYLTCIVAGVDDRLKVAVPVYGCGFLHEDSVWKASQFDRMTPDRRDRWVGTFDPSKYLPRVRCPILFVNGTNDFAYPLDSYRRSYEAVPGFEDLANPDRLCVTLRMPHGHEQGWKPKEIGIFVDGVLKQGEPLAKLAGPAMQGGRISAKFASKAPIEKAELLYAIDAGPWPMREWKAVPATIEGEIVGAPLPPGRPLVAFLNVVDRRGAVVSSPYLVVPKAD